MNTIRMKNVLSVVLVFALVISLFAGLAPIEAYALGSAPAPSEAEKNAPVTTFDLQLEVTDEGIVCPTLPSPTSENYKWVYCYFPEQPAGSFDTYVANMTSTYQDIVDTCVMKQIGFYHKPADGFELIEIPSSGIIPKSDSPYRMLFIIEVYDWQSAYKDFYAKQFTLFDVSENGITKNVLKDNRTPSYPVGDKIADLGDDSIVVENNVAKVNVPDASDDYLYMTVALSESALEGSGYTLEMYRDMINGGKNKDIIDVKPLADDMTALSGYQLGGQIYTATDDEPDYMYPEGIDLTEKTLVFVLKLHKDNKCEVVGLTPTTYAFAVYAAHAEIVAPTGNDTPTNPPAGNNPTNPPAGNPSETPNKDVPKTGDANTLLPMMALVLAAGVAVVITNKKRKVNK